MLYSAFTYYTGSKVNSGEYRVMGLAPYGQPRFVDHLFDKVVELKDDGSFKLDMQYFNYLEGLTMTGPRSDELFRRAAAGNPSRRRRSGKWTSRRRSRSSPRKWCSRMARRPQRDGDGEPLSRGRRRTQLRRQRPAAARSPFRRIWIQPAAATPAAPSASRSRSITRSSATTGASTPKATACTARIRAEGRRRRHRGRS